MSSSLLSKAINSVTLGARGELSEAEFNAISSSPEFINALRAKEEAFQANIKPSSAIEAVVLKNRFSDEKLMRNYYLYFVKHPLLLTDKEWFEIDPKGDADLLRDTHFALWNFDSENREEALQKIINIMQIGSNSRIKNFYKKRLKRSRVFQSMMHSVLVIRDPAKKEYCVRLVIENLRATLPRGCGKNPILVEV